MTDQPPAERVMTEERFGFNTTEAASANAHLTHNFNDVNTNTLRIVEWITPDALPAGHPLHFSLSLLPTGPRGVVRYKSPLGILRVLIVHVERPGMVQ